MISLLNKYQSMWLVSIAVLLLWISPAKGNALDSAGKNFLFAFQDNHPGASQALIVFITSIHNTSGQIKIPGMNFSRSFSVTANQITSITIPNTAHKLQQNAVSNKGIFISAKNEITVYGINQVQHTTDAFLALPVDVLGTEYSILSYPSLNGGSQAAVIANHDDTQVTITPTININTNQAYQPFSITLNKGEVYSINASSHQDLTGTLIKSNAPVAVMSGAFCANVPIGYSACDHLVEMMPPLTTWGKSFLSAPLATRKKGELFRILTSQDGTEIKINEKKVATINQGQFYETFLTKPSLIETSKAVLVAQFSPGTNYDQVTSDPFMVLVPPTEQFLTDYVFTTPASGFSKHFVNVVMPASATDSLKLNGNSISKQLFKPIIGTGFKAAQVPIAKGSHHISGEAAFGIYVYGFADADSYGYTGGMAFELINPVGDHYKPNLLLKQLDHTAFRAIATDSEDINANLRLDEGEDINKNNRLDARTEDINNNQKLDRGEDTNADGVIGLDSGLLKIELIESENLVLNIPNFKPGEPMIEFEIRLKDPQLQGSGKVRVTDVAGNYIEKNLSQLGGGFVTFASPKPVNLGLLKLNKSHSGLIDFTNATVISSSLLQLTTNFDKTGMALEVEIDGQWKSLDKLNPQSITLSEYGAKIWNIRLRVGDCPEKWTLDEQFEISVNGTNADGKPVDNLIPISTSGEIISPSWFYCFRYLIYTIIISLFIIFIIYGFISPSRFSPRLGIVISPEADINEGFFHPVRATRGTGSGFYRDARVYVCADYRLSGASREGFVCLRAEGKRVKMLSKGGEGVWRKTVEDEWEQLPQTETAARTGVLYKNDLGTLFFEIRNG